MCVIVHQPKGAHLDKERAARLWSRNNDGGGFAFIDDDRSIQVVKEMEFASFWASFELARSEYPKRDFLLHMRIATHGAVVPDNVHPFRVNEHTVMAHNGILHKVTAQSSDEMSDTRIFIDKVLPSLPEGWLDNPILVDMVQEWIGVGNKLMFLTSDPNLQKNVYILNKARGSKADKMWFSNNIGVPKPPPPSAHSRVTGFGYGRGSEDYNYLDRHRGTANQRLRTRTVYTEGRVVELSEDEYFLWLKERSLPSAMTSATVSQKVFAQGGLEGAVTLPNEEQRLAAKRERNGLVKDMFLNPVTGIYECLGCDGEVSRLTGECDCFEMICLDCLTLAADCSCKNGWSTNLVTIQEAPDMAVEEAFRKEANLT